MSASERLFLAGAACACCAVGLTFACLGIVRWALARRGRK